MSAAPVHPANSSGDPLSPERDALQRILQSDALNRAPNLVLFLRYVCEMQLTGRTDAIKEYNIAVEALGRSADFDQKKDSIVRVEAHRLRKRLTEYYEGPGARDPVQIVLPPGSYVPLFRDALNGNTTPVDSASEGAARQAPEPDGSAPVQAGHTRPRWLLPSALFALAVAVLAGIWWWQTAGTTLVESSRRIGVSGVTAAAGTESMIRIAAGSARDNFVDSSGAMWNKDRFFTGGIVMTAPPRTIRRTTDDALYLTRREGQFEYRIPVPPGSYELRLHFAETVFGEDNVAGGDESSRVFQVQVNGGELWTADIISEAGDANTADVRVYRNVQPTPDGAIHIAFRTLRKEAAFVNAIEVLPAPDGRSLPVRMVARSSSLVLPSGEEWWGDHYWHGGSTVLRHEVVQGPEPSMLYQAERYGNFSYAVPAAAGTRYTLILRFAETWFGDGRPGGGGAGSRVFDVYCDGKTLLRNFDVYREAGGPLRQIKKVFRGLEPNAQGKLNLQFVPTRNYAMVNAIEVLDEGR